MAISGIDKRDLKGSPSRDEFKHWHKNEGPRSFYASDLDLVFVAKSPPGIVAAIDYKQPGDDVSFAEVLTYNWHIEHGCPVYIVTSTPPFETLKVEQYVSGDWRPNPVKVQLQLVQDNMTPEQFWAWERSLRTNHRKQPTAQIVQPIKSERQQLMELMLKMTMAEIRDVIGEILTGDIAKAA